MSKPPNGVWDKRLRCNVRSLTYDFGSQTGQLYLTDFDCCDMGGCISIFEAIDPRVTEIKTYSVAKGDLTYRKRGAKWVALTAEMRHRQG
jgi:hypothetical protein